LNNKPLGLTAVIFITGNTTSRQLDRQPIVLLHARNMISYWHDTVVCLSVLSVTLYSVAFRIGAGTWKFYCRVP